MIGRNAILLGEHVIAILSAFLGQLSVDFGSTCLLVSVSYNAELLTRHRLDHLSNILQVDHLAVLYLRLSECEVDEVRIGDELFGVDDFLCVLRLAGTQVVILCTKPVDLTIETVDLSIVGDVNGLGGAW